MPCVMMGLPEVDGTAVTSWLPEQPAEKVALLHKCMASDKGPQRTYRRGREQTSSCGPMKADAMIYFEQGTHEGTCKRTCNRMSINIHI